MLSGGRLDRWYGRSAMRPPQGSDRSRGSAEGTRLAPALRTDEAVTVDERRVVGALETRQPMGS